MVYFIQCFSVAKNFGQAINDTCRNIPNDNDWVCLTDMDTMFLRPDAGKQIIDIVRKHKEDYQLIGCMTNRLAQPYQLYKGMFNEDGNIKNHIKIAHELNEKFYGQVQPLQKVVAGCFMLFPKRVWRQIGFYDDGFDFDIRFCTELMQAGGKIGLAKGLYHFHLYRMWSNDPIKEKKHLYK